MMVSGKFKWKLYASALLLILATKTQAQIPTTCFEIESILVAACGQPEGENEMVRFVVGPNALDVSNLNASWPNGGNPWRGVCTSASTTSKIATINSTIINCGLVLEPVGGILPAGAKVVLVTSVNMVATANSFANLTDTIYMIFQCAGNTQGHFKNYGVGVGSRTLSMTFGSGCSDVVTYYPGLLTTPSGNVGDGPGGTVMFDWQGNDSYRNFGCQAPINIASVEVQANKNSLCVGDSVFLGTTIQNILVTGITWSGGTGTFTSPNTLNTYYIAGNGDNGTVTLRIDIAGTCGNSLSDSITLTIPGNFISALTIDPPPPYCNGDVVKLSVTGGANYSWSTGSTSSSINVTSSGTYTVTASNACYAYADSAVISFSTVNAAFTSDINYGLAPLIVTFFDQSTNAALIHYDFGDGYTDNIPSPIHTFESAGIYEVVQTVTNSEGCTDEITHNITVAGDTVAFFPNAFTPNNDGNNEIFLPLGSNVINSQGTIYNRWGEKIYTWDNSAGWNGSSDGKAVAAGIYAYVTDLTFVWGETVRKKGWVMVVR